MNLLKRGLFVFGLSLLFLATASTAQESELVLPELPDPVPVNDVVLEGLEIWSGEDIEGILRRTGLQTDQTYEQQELQQLVREGLERLHQEDLFSDIQVRYEDRQLIFELVEYPRITDVTFEGNESLSDEEIGEILVLGSGDPASDRAVNEATRQIEQFYSVQGYGQAQVNTTIEEVEEQTVEVIFSIEEGPQQTITSMEFEHVDDIGIFRTVQQAWNLRWRLPVNVGSPFSPQVLQQAVSEIENWYQERGHMEVQVVPSAEPDPDAEGMRVTFVIQAGPVYEMGNLTISGNEAIETSQLRQQVELTEGEVFDRALMEEGLQEMEFYYNDRGYADAEIFQPDRYEYNLDREDHVVNVDVNVQEGEPVIVERIDIRGNQLTYDKVIRREVLLEEGELLDGQQLRRTQRRLRQLGFFQQVEINVDPGSAPDRRVVRVRVREGPTGQLQFGGGYSSSVGFLGNFSVQKDNFSLWDPGSAFTGRGQSLQASAQVGADRSNYYLSWDDPWINDDVGDPTSPSPSFPISFGWSGFNQSYDREQNFSERRAGGALRSGIEFGVARANMIDAEYSFRRLEAFNIDEDSPERYKFEAECDGSCSDDSFDRQIGSVELGIQRDLRDSRRFPSEGYYIRLSGLVASSDVFGGNSDYYRPRLEGRQYQPIWGPLYTAVRTNFRTVDTWEQDPDAAIPVFDEFFLGGYRDIRGYEYRDLAVRDDSGSIIGGGRTAFYTNAELRFRMIEDGTMQLFTFYDLGNVYEESWEFDGSDLKTSAGVGMRVFTPIGPISISWAQRLNETYDGAGDRGESQVDFNIGSTF